MVLIVTVRYPKATSRDPQAAATTLTTRLFRDFAPWPGNQRKRGDASKLTDLAGSIAKTGHCKTSWLGRRPKVLEIAAGERRYRVVEQLTKEGRGTEDYPMPVSIRVLSDLAPLAWVEN